MTAVFDCVVIADCLTAGHVGSLRESLSVLAYRHAFIHTTFAAAGENWRERRLAGGSSRQTKASSLFRPGDLLDPELAHEARLAIVIVDDLPEPEVFRTLRLEVAKVVICLTRSPALAGDVLASTLARVDGQLREMLRAECSWTATEAPVREALQITNPTIRLSPPLPLLIPGAAEAVDRAAADRPIRRVGRHWLPGQRASPEALSVFASALAGIDDLVFGFMGEPDVLRDLWHSASVAGTSLAAWQATAYATGDLPDWLAGLDLFLAFGADDTGDAVALEALQAIAAGAIVVDCEPGGGALASIAPTVPLAGIAGVARRLSDERSERQRWRGLQARWLRDQHGPASHRDFFSELIGAPSRRPCLVTPKRLRRPRYILFVSGNGVGMGHLTRQLAVARRLPSPLSAYFFSLSPAARVVEALGFPVDYAPAHTLAVDPSGEPDLEHWNRWLDAHLSELMAFIDAAVVVFDGNRPYRGLLSALAKAPMRARIWVRRGLWRAGSDAACLADARNFDLVVEPDDFAGDYDSGPTRERAAHRVPPVRLLDDNEVLERAAAGTALGLDPDRKALLLQLGSRNNFDYDAVERAVMERSRSLGIQVLAVEWLNREIEATPIDELRRVALYPSAQYHRAFDFAVAAAGYNAFHELLLNGVPTIFVPNENPKMDDQLARARFAVDRGFALAARAGEPYALAEALRKLLDGETHRRLRDHCAGLSRANGAAEIAQLIEAHAFGLQPSARRQAAPAVETEIQA